MMKKNLWFLLVAVFMFAFSACSDDDDNTTIAEKLSGKYTGTINIYLLNDAGEVQSQIGEQMSNQVIYMVATGERELRLELRDFQFSPEIKIERIIINTEIASDNKSIVGENNDIVVLPGISATARVTGTIVDRTADLAINVSAPLLPAASPVKMQVKFLGTK